MTLLKKLLPIALALGSTLAFADDTTTTAGSTPVVAATAPAAAAMPVPAAPAVAIVPPLTWKANAVLGYIGTSGTGTDTRAFKGNLHGEISDGEWTHQADALALSTQDQLADTNTERYLVNAKSSRNINPMNYGYVAEQWENDHQSAYNYQASMNVGYGHYFLKDDVQHLSLEVGAGERHSEPKLGHPENDAVGDLSLHYHWQINEAVRFTQHASVEDGRVGRVLRSFSELKSMLSKKLAASVSYDYKNDDSNGGSHSGITSVNLSYEFD